MSDIKFNCPQCGQPVVCDISGAGASLSCPTCQTAIVVPVVDRVSHARSTESSPSSKVTLVLIVLLGIGLLSYGLLRPRTKVLECMVHEFLGKDAADKIVHRELTFVVKIKASENSGNTKNDFKLLTSSGGEVECDNYLFLGVDRVGFLDPNDNYAKQNRAVISFKVTAGMVNEKQLMLKVKDNRPISLPHERKRIGGVFKAAK